MVTLAGHIAEMNDYREDDIKFLNTEIAAMTKMRQRFPKNSELQQWATYYIKLHMAEIEARMKEIEDGRREIEELS
jgi:hypothetical protein